MAGVSCLAGEVCNGSLLPSYKSLSGPWSFCCKGQSIETLGVALLHYSMRSRSSCVGEEDSRVTLPDLEERLGRKIASSSSSSKSSFKKRAIVPLSSSLSLSRQRVRFETRGRKTERDFLTLPLPSFSPFVEQPLLSPRMGQKNLDRLYSWPRLTLCALLYP